MKHLTFEQKNIMKERGYLFSIVPVSGYSFWYLFSTGFWLLGTLSSIYTLLKIKDNFLKKINIVGTIYSIIWFLLNILLILLIFPVINKSSYLYLPEHFSSIENFLKILILLAVNIAYINVIGLIISIIVRKNLPVQN
ncbi:MAG: hypothetical protein K2H11_02865 [Malacoplasma sp.]|nr:hypothetical protein [Malacoplasma sp.]